MKTFRLRSLNLLPLIFGAVSIGCLAQAASSPSPQHLFFRVTLGAQQTTPVSGRLILFIKQGTKPEDVERERVSSRQHFNRSKGYRRLEARRIGRYRHRQHCVSRWLFQVATGDYVVQAVLDTSNKYSYYGRQPGDIESAPTLLAHWTAGQGEEPQLTLMKTIQPKTRDWLSPKMTRRGKTGCN